MSSKFDHGGSKGPKHLLTLSYKCNSQHCRLNARKIKMRILGLCKGILYILSNVSMIVLLVLDSGHVIVSM
jgi:hypothetical protein